MTAITRPADLETTADPVTELIAQGAGRRKLAEALNLSEHHARVMLEERRNGHTR